LIKNQLWKRIHCKSKRSIYFFINTNYSQKRTDSNKRSTKTQYT